MYRRLNGNRTSSRIARLKPIGGRSITGQRQTWGAAYSTGKKKEETNKNYMDQLTDDSVNSSPIMLCSSRINFSVVYSGGTSFISALWISNPFWFMRISSVLSNGSQCNKMGH
jgi:hypothetical protein